MNETRGSSMNPNNEYRKSPSYFDIPRFLKQTPFFKNPK